MTHSLHRRSVAAADDFDAPDVVSIADAVLRMNRVTKREKRQTDRQAKVTSSTGVTPDQKVDKTEELAPRHSA
jgi:hypothetical protein